MNKFRRAINTIDRIHPYQIEGHVLEVSGLVVEASGPQVAIGSTVFIETDRSEVACQIVGFRSGRVLLMSYSELHGVAPGDKVAWKGGDDEVIVSESLLGRIVDGEGNPVDGKGVIGGYEKVPLFRAPPNPMLRQRIHKPFDVGVRAINSMLTVGVGQRVGIMAGSGVGKSTLLGMIARNAESDINVIGLIGERGREVREFIEKDLGPEGLARSVVVVATGDQSALARLRGAFLATAYAEYFRSLGKQVVLMLDSVTRFAMAQREIGLATGEPPSSKGYTPSVFSMLPRLLERAGLGEKEGSITALYTVLVEGDDMNEPIADAVRGILDGHIVLSRSLASKGHYPAIEILESVSRCMVDITNEEIQQTAMLAREVLAIYREAEDLISIGAYKEGQNPKIDIAISLIDTLTEFLRQHPSESSNFHESVELLKRALSVKATEQ